MSFIVGAASILVTQGHTVSAGPGGPGGAPCPFSPRWPPGLRSVARLPQRWQRRHEFMSLCPHLTSLCAASGEMGTLAPRQTLRPNRPRRRIIKIYDSRSDALAPARPESDGMS